jgi:hypothetical protein
MLLRCLVALGTFPVFLLGCNGQSPADSPRAARDAAADNRSGADPAAAASQPARVAAEAAPAAELPFLAVNTVDALLPLGRTRGRLGVTAGCLTFQVRDQTYTPVWPQGSRLSPDGTRVIGPGGESFPIGEDVTLDGASFSLANDSMRLGAPVPRHCPSATYAVNL